VVNLLLALAVFLATLLAEALHAARSRRIGYLAFGPHGRPRAWVKAVAPLRAIGMAAVCWGLLLLWQIAGAQGFAMPRADSSAEAARHVVIALDVSPSMQLTDAGPHGQQTREERARQVLRSILDRLDMQRSRVSVVAFFSEARPVVIDTFDPEVVANILGDLPLEHAFSAGKTNMYAGVRLAGEIGKKWRTKSALLILASDGDTLPAEQPPALPESFSTALIVGIGNPHRGIYIDEHSSRQDDRALKRLASQLSGTYYDANTKHLPTDAVSAMAVALPTGGAVPLEMRDVALAAVAVGAALLALLPAALKVAGKSWSPARARPVPTLGRQGQLVG
jgi:Ca-activated chloride channel family protein